MRRLLTWAQVEEIREHAGWRETQSGRIILDYAYHGMNAILAKKHGVSEAVICDLLAGRSYMRRFAQAGPDTPKRVPKRQGRKQARWQQKQLNRRKDK